MDYRHRVKICSSLADISAEVNREIDKLSTILEDKDLIFDLRLILNELLINAGEHGNSWNKAKCIDYEIIVNDHYIYLSVRDEGDGIKAPKLFDPDLLDKHGRGLKIVKELSDDLSIENTTIRALIYL